MTRPTNEPIPRELTDARVLIAGGTSGVGLATATTLARAGAQRIVLLGRNPERGDAAVHAVRQAVPGAAVSFVRGDANDLRESQEAVSAATDQLGGLDVLVCTTVSPYFPTLFVEQSPEDIRDTLMGQALAPMLLCRAAVPVMREGGGGSIIAIASDAAKVPTPGETVLGGAMSAIVTFCRTLALEAKRYGIRVNVLTPSLIVNTGSYDRVMEAEFSKKIFDRIVASAHLGLTEPEDLADAIAFLASPQSRRITGQVISVNGGISIA